MLRFNRFFPLAVLATLLGACTAPQRQYVAIEKPDIPSAKSLYRGSEELDTQKKELAFTVEFVDQSGNTLDERFQPKNLSLSFPSVSGSIFGSPNRRDITHLTLSGKREGLLSPSQLAPLSQAAQTLQPRYVLGGLQIKPKDTRLARMGSFVHNLSSGQSLGAVGFQPQNSDDYLMLVYVDQACEISGGLQISGTRYQHDIRLPGPGFHWIHVQDLGEYSLLRRWQQNLPVRLTIVSEDVKAL